MGKITGFMEFQRIEEGGNTYVSGDTNGDKTADFMIGLTGAHALAGTDFIL